MLQRRRGPTRGLSPDDGDVGSNQHQAFPRKDFEAVEGGGSPNAHSPSAILSEEVDRFNSSSSRNRQNPTSFSVAHVAADSLIGGPSDGLSRGPYGVNHSNSSSKDKVLKATTSTADASTGERAAFPSVGYLADEPKVDVGGTPATKNSRGPFGNVGVGRAVMEAAQQLAHRCQIPGVNEAATLVSILAELLVNSRSIGGSQSSLKRCHSIVIILKRAAKVLGKVRRFGLAGARLSFSV